MVLARDNQHHNANYHNAKWWANLCGVKDNAFDVLITKAEQEVTVRIAKLCRLLKEKVRQKSDSMSDEGRLEALMKSFKFFDRDESGTVTPEEFNFALMSYGIMLERKERPGSSFFSQFFNKFDPDRSGTITYDEFATHLYVD